MNIYNRDYRKLTDEEKVILQKYSSLATDIKLSHEENMSNNVLRIELNDNHSFIKHQFSLFPNNYIRLNSINKSESNIIIKEFDELINNKKTIERDVLKFIKEKNAYFIIATLFNKTDFGNHDSAIFKEFPLGTNYKADFLLVGKNSYGYHFIFVELEAVHGSISIGDGDLGEVLRKGQNQVQDWKHFLEKDFLTLKSEFNKHKHFSKDLPKEFYEFDSNRMNFVVIAGRRSEFTEKTKRIALELKRKNNIEIIHYDRLIEYSKEITNY